MNFTGLNTGFFSRQKLAARVLVAVFAAAIAGATAPAQNQGVGKTPPPQDQGAVGPSGKFVPAAPSTPNGPGPLAAPSLKVDQTSSNTFRIGAVELDKILRTITIPAKIRVRNQIIEYALVHESGKGYESLLTTECAPVQINLAFILLGLSPMEIPAQPGTKFAAPSANSLEIHVHWETNSASVTKPLASLIALAGNADEAETAKTLPQNNWSYNGSVFDAAGFAAQREGSVVSLIRDASALVNNAGTDLDNDQIHHPKAAALPPENWPVRVIFQLPTTNAAPRLEQAAPGVTPVTPPLVLPR